MSTTHTPGPWAVIKHATPDHAPQFGIYAEDTPARDIAIATGPGAESNARLISASPELLSSLEDAARCLEEYRKTGCMPGWDRTLKLALAAIAKATQP